MTDLTATRDLDKFISFQADINGDGYDDTVYAVPPFSNHEQVLDSGSYTDSSGYEYPVEAIYGYGVYYVDGQTHRNRMLATVAGKQEESFERDEKTLSKDEVYENWTFDFSYEVHEDGSIEYTYQITENGFNDADDRLVLSSSGDLSKLTLYHTHSIYLGAF